MCTFPFHLFIVQCAQKRANLFLRAKRNLTDFDDWIRAQTLFGITTYYRREIDESLSIKLEGHLTGIPLFEQVAVLREVDLYHSWAPFCVSSSRLAQLGKIDVVAWLLTGLPQFGLSRDACFRAIGCDSMREDGSILLVGEGLGDRAEDGVGDAVASSGENRQRPSGGGGSPARRVDRDISGSIHNESSNYSNWTTLSDEYEYGSYLSRDSVLETIQIPPVPTTKFGFGSGRMTIRSFQGQVDVLSPTSAKTRLITNIDPNLNYVPQSLIDFCMKKLCGILLSRLQGAARTILKDPVHSLHARRMREDVQFYRMWLLPKFRSHCEDLGWELPPVAAFNVSEEDLDEEEWLLYSQWNRREGDPDDNEDFRRTKGDAAIGDTAIRRGCSERAISLDGQPTSRRLFSSTGSMSGHDRTVASAPVALQMRRDEEGMRTKLRQLLPAESMEIALTRPDLLQRWEQRQAKKKALEVASARRRAALRLRPAQPTEKQAKRLAQLKEAKERFLVGKQNSTAPLTLDETARVADRMAQETGTRSASTVIIEFLSFTHPSIPHKVALPIMMAGMFVLYHADNNLLHWNFEKEGLSGTLAYNAIFLAVLILYSMIHWIVTNLALVVAFDFIELPLLSLAGTKRELENAKALYTRNVRTIAGLFSMAILVLVMSSCLLSYLWNHSISSGLPQVQHFFRALFVPISSIVGDKAENVANLALISSESLIAQIVRRIGIIIGPIFFVIKWLHSFLIRLWHLATLGLFVGFGSSVKDWTCSCLVSLFAVGSDNLNESWREETLEMSKRFFSYSSVFLFSFIAIAHIAFPTYKSSGLTVAHLELEKENAAVKTSEMPIHVDNDAPAREIVRGQGLAIATTAGSSASLSLASGELVENPPTPALRLRAATRSLASTSPNGIDTSKSRKLRFGRRQAAGNKISSARSV